MLLLLTSVYSAQNDNSTVRKKTILESQVVRIEAQPKKGFLYPFFLYVPPEVTKQKKQNKTQTFLVLPNNTGNPDDDLAVHAAYSAKQVSDLRRLASRLGVVLLQPVFPRPQTDWQIYTHALDRDSLLTDKREYKRLDRQLIKMIDNARARLAKEGLRLDKRVLMFGFSASGMFTNRFAFLHPKRIRAAAFGSPGGWAIAPADSWKGEMLRYPIGTADIKLVSGKSLDRKNLRRVPLFLFLGDKDTNDSVIFRDSYEKEDEELIFNLFGKTLVERWTTTESLYKANLPQATLKLYAEGEHSLSKEMWQDITAFFSKNLSR